MPPDWTQAMVLSLVELDACWELLDLGETPWQLRLPSPGRTYPEREAIVAAAVLTLRERGLAGAVGAGSSLHRPLTDALRALARPDHAFDLHVRDTVPLAGVGAVAGETGVVALRHGEQVGLLLMPHTAVPGALVDLVGAMRPGVGQSVNVPADVFDAAQSIARPDGAGGGLWEFADALTARGIAAADARSLARMCTGIEQVGQLGATITSTSSRLRRCPWVIGFHRTAVGHYIQLRRPALDGQLTVTIAPVDGRRLVGLLDELLAATSEHAAA